MEDSIGGNNKKLVLLKLGGSVISDKSKINDAKIEEIEKISQQIKDLNKKYQLILFTGAGGFGHPVALRYRNNLREGKDEIKKSCKNINEIVVSVLNKNGLQAKTYEPDKVVSYSNKVLINVNQEIFNQFNNGIIPVFHADLVNDHDLGISILSMDKFLVDLAIYLKNKGYDIDKAIFLGATPVLDLNNQVKKVVNKITHEDYLKNKSLFFKSSEVDVSGGMRYKVEQALRLIEYGIKSNITDDLFKQGTLVT